MQQCDDYQTNKEQVRNERNMKTEQRLSFRG